MSLRYSAPVIRRRRRPVRAALVVVLLSVVAAACSQGAVSPDQSLSFGIGFRGGPQRTGVVDGAGPSHPSEQWSIDTGAHVTSSPVPLEDGVVVLGGDGTLRRVDIDGSREWGRHIGPAEATPVVIGDVALEPSSSGSLLAVSLNDGEVIWKQDLGGPVRSSPLVSGSHLIVAVDDQVVIVDISDGTVLDRFPLGASTGSSPALSDRTVVIGDSDNEVIGLDRTHGSRLWAHDFGPSPEDVYRVADGVVATPAIAKGVVYVGSVNGRMAALAVPDGSVKWQVTLDGPVYASAAVGDAVFVTTAAGDAVGLDPETGQEVWATNLGGASYSSPTLASQELLVTTEAGIVFGLDPVDGAIMWQARVGVNGDYMASTPTLVSGVVVVGSNDGRVVALGDDGAGVGSATDR